MHRPFLLLPYTRFSRVSPAHYTAKGEICTPFCNRFTGTFTGACGGLIMDALTAHVFALFGLCTAPATRAALLPVHLFAALIVGGILCTDGLNNPGFVYRIRQAVCKHPCVLSALRA